LQNQISEVVGMTYSQKLAQKLLHDIVNTSAEVASIVLIDLHQAMAVASYIGGTLPLAAPDGVAQLLQYYAAHQSLNHQLGINAAMSQVMIRYEEANDRNLDYFIVLRASATQRWLIVLQLHAMAKLGVALLDLQRLLQQCDELLIDDM
jgi:hypothetical protein